MSATNRGGKREIGDLYITPHFVWERFVEKAEFLKDTGDYWLEPSAGTGAVISSLELIQAGSPFHGPITWEAVEVDPQHEEMLKSNIAISSYHITDFFSTTIDTFKNRPSVIIGNPPYSLSQQFLEVAFDITSQYVIYLMRTNFLSSQKRHDFMSKHTPDVYLLPNRPCFTNGKSDNSEYAIMVWDKNKPVYTPGRLVILNTTPKADRTVR